MQVILTQGRKTKHLTFLSAFFLVISVRLLTMRNYKRNLHGRKNLEIHYQELLQ